MCTLNFIPFSSEKSPSPLSLSNEFIAEKEELTAQIAESRADIQNLKDDKEQAIDVYKRQAEYRTELIEKICELDDDLMMQYLEGEEPSVEDMKKVLRKATCECTAAVSYTHLSPESRCKGTWLQYLNSCI